MAGSYVPPHLRRQSDAAATAAEAGESPDSDLVTLYEIANFFKPEPKQEGNEDEGVEERESRTVLLDDISQTLHDSAETPDELAYVILFPGANPRWGTDQIIFSKSSLHLLPQSLRDDGSTQASASEDGAKGDDARAEENDHMKNEQQPSEQKKTEQRKKPIAVFNQTVLGTKWARAFAFEGWFNIERIAILEPRSPELIRMLEQKWAQSKQRRSEGRWEASLRQHWAVVKLVKDEVAERERGKPRIERLPEVSKESAGPKKSVNEMLAEMRDGDARAGVEASTDG